MAYSDIVEMAQNESLRERITACAAQEGEGDPHRWTLENVWHVASAPGWADSWAYARDTSTINQNPDLGVRTDVITDGNVLSAVQARQAELATP